MNAGLRLVRPGWLSQRTPASSSVAAAPTPLTGCAAYLDHRTPGHRVCAFSEDCPAFTRGRAGWRLLLAIAAKPLNDLVRALC